MEYDNDDIFSFSNPDNDDKAAKDNTDGENDFGFTVDNDIFSEQQENIDDTRIFFKAPEYTADTNEAADTFGVNDEKDIYSYSTASQTPETDGGEVNINGFSGPPQKNKKGKNKTKMGKNGKKKGKSKSKKKKILKIVLTVFLVGVITASIVIGAVILYVFTAIDGTMKEDLNDLKLNFTTTVYCKDAEGNWQEYQRLHGEFNRIWVSYDAQAAKKGDESYEGIPQNLVDAFVAIEDKRFYTHSGVDWKRTTAAFANLFLHFYSSNQGGSTITQQLVKNLTGDTAQKPSRKMREIMRARYLENHYSKDTIIECYLNTIAMGNGIYGVQVAANYYFGKDVKDLTLPECASLAAITKSPADYSPDENPENNKERRDIVLSEMRSQGYISKKEYKECKGKDIEVTASKELLKETDVNNYYVDALITQVVKDIAEKYGYDESHAANMFYSGGYKIYCTVNPDVQTAIDEVYASARDDGVQSAICVMDYSGNVVGMSGGLGEKTVNLGFNRATDAVRQPGSTIKPLAAYAPAIESNLINYSTIVEDKVEYYGDWYPTNWYSGVKGKVTVEHALEQSINTIPVMLIDKLKLQKSYDFLKKIGLNHLTEDDKNLSALGMGGMHNGITPMESVAAYAMFGNGGKYYEPKLYFYVEDQHGNKILSNEDKSYVTAISAGTATVMNKLLQNVVSHGTGYGAAGYVPGMEVYGKTGTSNDTKDLWFVGGTPYYVASCWCGYDTPAYMNLSNVCISYWGQVMNRIHAPLPNKNFEISADVVKREYCTKTGLLATDACPDTKIGWYKKSDQPDACEEHEGILKPIEGNEEDQKRYSEEKKKEEDKKKAEEDKKKQEEETENLEESQNTSEASGN